MVELDEPLDIEGEQVTERIDTVTWSGGRIRPGEFQEFGVSFRTPEEAGTELAFPAIQTYSNGEVVRWIGPEEGEAAEPAATPTQDTGSTGEEDEGSDTLSIVALIAGLAGLAAGLAALFLRRPAAVR